MHVGVSPGYIYIYIYIYILHHCSQIMIAEIQCQVDGVAISIRHGVTSFGTEEKRRK